MNGRFLTGVSTALILVGCGKSDLSSEKTFLEMKSDDVIVQVNDVPLYKRDVEIALGLNRRALDGMKGLDQKQIQEAMKRELLSYVPRFVFRRLLIDDAKRRATLDSEFVSNRVETALEKQALAQKKDKAKYLADLKDAAGYVRQNIEDYIWLNAEVATNIPPKMVVNAQFVSNYLAQIRIENAKIVASNDVIKASLERIRQDVMAGKVAFSNEAERVSEQPWDLGEMERTDFSDKALRDVAYSLKEGMVSPALENEDEGEIAILYVAKVIPAVKNDKGQRVHPEKRVIQKITVSAEPRVIEPAFNEAFADLRRQLQEQAVEEYVEVLKTNGQNRIVWPHGTNLFSKAEVKKDDK